MKASDSAIVVSYTTTDGDATFVLGRLGAREEGLKHLLSMLSATRERQVVAVPDSVSTTPTPEDNTLDKMNIVLSGKLANTSIEHVANKVWSEGVGTSEEPFYGPWLAEEECFEISVGDWEIAGSDGFPGPWCNENYSKRRLVTFKFKRTTHLYIGPPVAFVKQMHYCRVEGNEKCVVAISATFEGIPYSDCFSVEMRWVARRLSSVGTLEVKVGLVVDFKKTTMLKNQIKFATMTETKNVHRRMFKAVQRVCSEGETLPVDGKLAASPTEPKSLEADSNLELDSNPTGTAGFLTWFSHIPVSSSFMLFTCATFAYPFLWNFFSKLFGSPALTMNEANVLHSEILELRHEVRALRSSLDTAITLLKQRG